MAQIPTDDEALKAQVETQKKIRNKRNRQKKLGKDFVIDEHSAGVIPEAVWKGLKA